MYPLEKKTYLDDLLSRIGEKLQLDKTRRQTAEERYKAVSGWLHGDEFFKKFDLDIFPHGSFRLGTTTKPWSGDEYDLDFVLKIIGNLENINPVKVLDHLEARLRANDIYKGKISRHKRCVRINYANEFHIDILPAFPVGGVDSHNLRVPDRDLMKWMNSNPEGYAKAFESKYIPLVQLRKSLLFEKAAHVQDLPDDLDYDEKQPIQRAVQLMKRYRDVFFEKNPDNAPKSIILTTLCYYFYNNEQTESKALSTILNSTVQHINTAGGRPFKIENPEDKGENFSECWSDTNLFNEFKNYINSFSNLWNKLTVQQGIHNIEGYLNSMFGETISKTAIKEQAEFMKSRKDSGKLNIEKKSGIITGLSSISTIQHQKNTNFGQ